MENSECRKNDTRYRKEDLINEKKRSPLFLKVGLPTSRYSSDVRFENDLSSYQPEKIHNTDVLMPQGKHQFWNNKKDA